MLENRSLWVKGVDEEDLSSLLQWRNSYDFRLYCTGRKHCVTPEEFKHEFLKDLAGDKHVQFIAYRKRDKSPVGTIWAYRLDTTHGHVCVTVFLDRPYRHRGYGAELMAAMLYHLFDSMPWLRKVYTEVYGINHHSLKTLRHAGFQTEAVLEDHLIQDGEPMDLYWLAMYRGYWSSDPDRINQRLLPGYAHTLRDPV